MSMISSHDIIDNYAINCIDATFTYITDASKDISNTDGVIFFPTELQLFEQFLVLRHQWLQLGGEEKAEIPSGGDLLQGRLIAVE
jgi:hypothetical protein